MMPVSITYLNQVPKIDNYTTEFTKLHGDANPWQHDVDERAVILAGKGRKHGRLSILHSVLQTTTTLTQARVSSPGGSTSTDTRVQPRAKIAALEVRLSSHFHPMLVADSFMAMRLLL